MVVGIESFKEWFVDYSGQYAIIGGTACDMLMSEDGLDFRATKDIDMVLIIESLTPSFGARFWEYIVAAGYEHKNKSTGEPQFYRFIDPHSKEYPYMIELFSRRNNAIVLPEDAVLTPIPLDDELSSLSAILMDDDYYRLLLNGITLVDGIPVTGAGYLIPLKAKAWLDLTERKKAGDLVDSKNIKKHKNDVFRLSALLSAEDRITIPDSIFTDLVDFLSAIETEQIDLNQLGFRNQNKEDILERIANAYIRESEKQE
jgi:hypothetical protein